jgi:hypothetical protein
LPEEVAARNPLGLLQSGETKPSRTCTFGILTAHEGLFSTLQFINNKGFEPSGWLSIASWK